MATVSLVLSSCDTKSASGGGMPVAKSQPKGKTSITSSASSQAVTVANAAKKSDVWIVTSVGGAVWVKFGVTPTASAGNDWYIPAGLPQAFGVSVDSETMAAIDAA